MNDDTLNFENVQEKITSKDLTVFKDDRFGSIRAFEIDSSPWFVAKDIAESLGYKVPKDAIGSHCKGAVKRRLPTSGGLQQMNTIPESDLYRLIMKSELPSAEAFQDWVFEVVLPDIRKNGEYKKDGTKPIPAIKHPSRSKIATDLAANVRIAKIFGLEGNQALLSANMMTAKQYESSGVNPLLESGVNLVVESKTQYLTPSEIGKQNGDVSGNQVNRMIKDAGFQEETRGRKNKLIWVITDTGKPFCRMQDTGKTHNGAPIMQIKWKADILKECAESVI